MLRFLEQVKDFVSYDAEREFYATVFPDSVEKKDILRIRRMKLDDFQSVTAIEKKVYNYPWTIGVFKDCFRAGYICSVCEDLENVIGYSILSVAAGEAHIMNVCVDPDEQKQGVGRKMIEEMIKVARQNKSESIYLEVRPSNEAAISLYKQLGFDEIGLRKDYYPAPEGREDALMLSIKLHEVE